MVVATDETNLNDVQETKISIVWADKKNNFYRLDHAQVHIHV
jgi:hypothetical protein